MSLSAAKSRLMQAKMSIDSRRYSDAESAVEAGLKFLDLVPPAEGDAVRAELEQVRATLAAMPKPEDQRAISSAERTVKQALGQIQSGYSAGDVEQTLANAEKMIAAVPEAQKKAVLEQIADARTKLPKPAAKPAPAAAAAPAPQATPAARPSFERAGGATISSSSSALAAAAAPVQPAAPKPASPSPASAPAAMSDEDRNNLSRAKSRLLQAKSALEARNTEFIPSTLAQVMELISALPAELSAPLSAEVDSLRGQMQTANAKEKARVINSELDRHCSNITSCTEMLRTEQAEASFKYIAERIEQDDAKQNLTPEAIAAVHARLKGLREKMIAAVKADALSRALPILSELESRVATDPFAGRDQMDAARISSELESLKWRVRNPASRIAAGDADLQSIHARLLAVEQKLDAASAKWGKAELDASVDNSWGFIEKEIAGWEGETAAAPTPRMERPELPKTRLAAQRTRWFLASPETEKIRAENKGEEKLSAVYRHAEQIAAAAAAKLDQAYGAILDAAEKLPSPLNSAELMRPGNLARDAEQSLAGSGLGAANIARAYALDARWKAELAAVMEARKELGEKLTAEAFKKWPAIRNAIATTPFDPETAKKGDVIGIEDVWNRCGWDYSGRYDFAVRVGETVVAGVYEAHVTRAIDHACYQDKVEVSDHIGWDLIGVVEGPGKIGRRTKVSLRDKFTHFEIGELETWPDVDCLRIRIIALHAGPVAVGP